MDVICQDCGEANPQGATFCSNCKAFLSWDGTTLIKPVPDEKPPQPGPVPPTAGPVPPTPDPVPPASDQAAPPPRPGPAPDQSRSAHLGSPGTSDPSGPTGPSVHPSSQAGSPTTPQPIWTTPAAGTTPPRSAPPAGSAGAAGGVPPLPPTAKRCPTCGHINPQRLRFCTRCGYSFVRLKVPEGSRQTPAQLAAADRAARRAYRRTLPPFYRWRRVGIAVLAVVVVTLAGVVTRGNPGRFLKDGWSWLNKEYVVVTPTSVEVNPAAVFPGSGREKLIDGTVNEFTMNWVPGSVAACAPGAGTDWITLNIAPARIRRIVISPGLDAGNAKRTLQPVPKRLAVRFGDGPCQSVSLDAEPGPLRRDLDSGEEVSQVHLAIAEAFPAGADAEPAISITEVVLKKYPD